MLRLLRELLGDPEPPATQIVYPAICADCDHTVWLSNGRCDCGSESILHPHPQLRRAMKILFLDDMPLRAELFHAWHPKGVWVQTAEEAITRLGLEEYDVVCLDHDLDEAGSRGDISDNSGMVVVDAIVRYPPMFTKTVFVVHTLNETAGPEMCRRLSGAGLHTVRAPFGAELFRLLETAKAAG